MLTADERQRYARQIALPEIGPEGQERLRASRVLIVGAGGLGSPAALYLAAAGVGALGLVDFDAVDITNLHRQLLHGTRDIGRPKVESALERLADVNPHVAIEPHRTTLSSRNAMALVSSYDLVVDASDNFQTRYLVNDACVLAGTRCVYGSVERFDGHVSVFGDKDGPCYRCLFREPPPPGLVPSCAEAGVFGVLPGLVGMLQATEVIKLVTGVGDSLVGRLLVIDAKRMRFRTVNVRRDPACPVCGTHEQTTLIDYEAFCGVTSAAAAPMDDEVDAPMLAKMMATSEAPLLIDVREAWEFDIARLPGAQLVPGSELQRGARELPRDRAIVLYCHSGRRSAYWRDVLRHEGFERVSHLRGGIDAWSREVDASVPRY